MEGMRKGGVGEFREAGFHSVKGRAQERDTDPHRKRSPEDLNKQRQKPPAIRRVEARPFPASQQGNRQQAQLYLQGKPRVRRVVGPQHSCDVESVIGRRPSHPQSRKATAR